MKKLISIALISLFVLCAVGCGASQAPSTVTSDTDAAPSTAPDITPEGSAGSLLAEKYLSGKYTALPQDGGSYNLIAAYAAAENSDGHTLMLAMQEAVDFYSGGKITLTLYPNGQMGSDAEIIASCIAGDIDLVLQSGSTHVALVPETAIFDTPFLFSGYDIRKIEGIIQNSEFRDLYNEANERGGLVCLLVKSADSMNLTANRAIESIEDLKGLKIRTAQSESRMAFWSSLGANPTPLAFSELYMALQNGTVDAQDNVWMNAVTSGAGEQQSHMIPTAHLMPSMDLTMSKTKFDSMPGEYQTFLKEICSELSKMDYDLSIESEQTYREQLQTEYGLILCEVSEEFLSDMKEAAGESIDLTRDLVGNDALYECLDRLLNE